MKKPVYYAAMTVLVEVEVRADSQEDAQAILKRKMQQFAATNLDVAVNEMVKKTVGFDLVPLP